MTPETAKLNEAMVVMSAEREVTGARRADLAEAHRGARARWIAAKGRLTRAMKDGNAAKIAAAQEHERAAYAEFDHVSGAALDEMFTLNRSSLDNLGRVLNQIGPAWDAEAEVTRQIITPAPEAEAEP